MGNDERSSQCEQLNLELGLLSQVEKSTRLSVAASARCAESECESGGWIQFIRGAICRL
jgi:hypothetical protein